MKAVSERLFSSAIAWSVSSGSHASSGITAAGLPVNGGRRRRRPGRGAIQASGCILRLLGQVGLGQRVAGLVDLALGIDVDQDLDARELRLAACARPRPSPGAPRRRSCRDPPRRGTGRNRGRRWCGCAGREGPSSAGWRAATSTKRRRFSSGHSLSISWSMARLEARQAPHSSHKAMSDSEHRVGAGQARDTGRAPAPRSPPG